MPRIDCEDYAPAWAADPAIRRSYHKIIIMLAATGCLSSIPGVPWQLNRCHMSYAGESHGVATGATNDFSPSLQLATTSVTVLATLQWVHFLCLACLALLYQPVLLPRELALRSHSVEHHGASTSLSALPL